MSSSYSKTVSTARDYYNSSDADKFYFNFWGGEDIHIGFYETPDDSISQASRKTVKRMAAKCENLNENSRVLDLGAGFGGAARYLAKTYGCHVTALNLSEVENERDRQMNKEQGLDHLIDVVDGAFESLPFEDGSFDVIWSQDAILHSDQRDAVIKEAARVLKPGGEMVFTDPMQSDDCPENVLQPIYDRIHLESLGSPSKYKKMAKDAGLEVEEFDELTDHLPHHYHSVLKKIENSDRPKKLGISDEYIKNMKKGLQHWVDGGKQGYLSWGIFHLKATA
ncbi:Sarcosine/dimethylglycine N-methyltransferase [Anaerohalosphaera lusitana]|uniref:Sarcosine/dimethylglycine N-methyltransferase n=1 Tax=Anaerohalosphaera lusitana TaxID=1936003 RepID=A0A1U9NLV9_9BACT|nr:methyltransferase domain-containing protein [Anaerohalosphaera lusitana]AQT68815.1 Sarcosine/dimethylglycine N-methyltransferase [Anaerohalosphaera lusitana]